jgi:GT2 family glycosyltransferase
MTSSDLRLCAPALDPPVTICVLLYGDHFFLCERFFTRLFRHTPADAFRLRIGLNAVCRQTAEYVHAIGRRHAETTIYESPENIYKGPMARRMFHEPPIETTWTLWFDDDSYVTRGDWLLGLGLAVETSPSVAMWGARYRVTAGTEVQAFIRSRPWYRGKPLLAEGDEAVIDFIAGGYWPIQTAWLRALDWPDSRILHYSDDYLLGEALRQNGGLIGDCTSGVVVNAAVRRSPPDTPPTY